MHRNTKLLALSLGFIPIGLSLINSSSAHAATLNPHIEITTEATIGSTTLEFKGTNERATTEYYVPVKIDYQDVRDFKVFIYATNETDLSEGNATFDGLYPGSIEKERDDDCYVAEHNGNHMQRCDGIVSLIDLSDRTKKLSSMGSHVASELRNLAVQDMTNIWGYRYNLANDKKTTDLPTGLYQAMPSAYNRDYKQIASASIDAGTMDSSGTGTKYLNLGFGAGITKSQAAGTYSGNAIVSVVATPYYVDLFDMQTRGMTMQDMTSEICEATPLPSKTATEPAHSRSEITYVDGYANKIPEVALVDRRQVGTKDGEPVYYSYLISRLADGNCWMRQNLSLVGGIELSSDNSDLTDGYTYQLPNSDITKFLQDDQESMYNGQHKNASYNTQGYASDTVYCVNDSSINCDGTNSGAYYSWLVAVAQKSIPTENPAPTSICPKGWKLPTGNGNFQALINEYSSNSTTGYSNLKQAWHTGNILSNVSGGLAFTGNLYNGKLHNSGTSSRWWSSELRSGYASSYFLNQDESAFAVMAGSNKGGNAVRCVVTTRN